MNRMNRMKWTKTLAGALLVLAVCLALVAPASAAPVMPLLFSGDVTIGGVNAPIGTSITAEIESAQVATATTTIVGRYVVSIDYDSGYIDKTVVLKVEGVVGGQGTYVDPMTTPVVTVNLAVAGVTTYTLTMAVSGGGSTTPAVGDHSGYTAGTVVNITALPAGGWQFGSWTGAVAAPTSATTTVTMNADKTVTANFELIPAAQKLIGADDVTATGNNAGGYLFCDRWTAEASGTIVSIKIKCGTSGNVKVAIYTNNSGEPGSLLNAVNTSTPVTSGWKTIAFPATSITQGTTYWLASASDVYCIGYKYQPGCIQKYKPSTYSTFTFPSSAGTGFAIYPGYNIIAGWGSAVAVVTPTPLPPTTPVTFSWTASAGALKYQLQVNTDPGFGSGTSVFDSELTTTTQVVAVPIGTTCYWHVRAGMPWSAWTPTGTVIP